MTVGFLFCADPLRPRGVDPHFAAQAQAVRDLGGTVALIDHDALTAGRVEEAVARVPAGFGPVWYRGWMLRTEQYRTLDETLRRRDCHLLTDARAYRTGHELPGWIFSFRHLTPATAVLPMASGEAPPDAERLGRLTAGLGGGFVVKDYVKSRKHEWLEACYAPDLAALERVSARFLELQGEDLTGGLVIREFERFDERQTRVWWLDGEPIFIGPHPDSSDGAFLNPGDLGEAREAVGDLAARFVTTDLARRDDALWRVIEVGDGQVSDWPSGVDPSALAGPLLAARIA
ncbi:ATP-grasp domain-containing protein [Nonomuraea sp. NPDC005983]|uniref:ATP-grasp domain-containing protein n=1 Tax=Nonomuraea sp. NPDC005983 TaxID=3155595 RepID=UPI0033BA06A8